MIEFAWKQDNEFKVGDSVKVSTSAVKLDDIGLDESYIGLNGIVTRTNNKATVVNFGKDTRAFYNGMLIKNTYNDFPDVDDYSADYIKAMEEAYGDIEVN